jgi:oligopeptidase B
MTQATPPIARREPLVIEQLGRTRTDDYAWMKDPGWQAVLRDPAVLRADIRDHLVAENAYTEAVLAETAALQEALFAEMVGRIRKDDSSVPAPDGPWDYYSRYAEGAQHPLLVRRPRGGGEEEVLLDVDAMAAPHAYYRLAGAEHSADHSRFAWAEDRQGSEIYTVFLIDLATRAAIGAPIESTTGNFALSPDGGFIFWTLRDDHGRPSAIYRRPVGGDASDDRLVYREPDPGFFAGVSTTVSHGWIVIGTGNQETSEAWLIPAAEPDAEPRLVAAREPGVRYALDHWGDRFVIRTNADGATDYKLVTAPEHDGARAGWRDLVPHRLGHFIVGFALFADYLVHVERVDANDRIIITERASGVARPLAIDEEAYCLSIDGGYEYRTTQLRYVYDSPREPRQVFDLDMANGERVLRKVQEVPSGHNPADYVVRRLSVTALDGAIVPLTLLARRDAFALGPCPTLLYGYGAYGIPMMPHFSTTSLSLVDRGWIWATAHIRGGSEKGWNWFLDGRGPHKPNTFSDFIACADHLIAAGHATAGRIVPFGGSAGGLLMGAVLNQRPELWAGVVASVPFVDVLNTMSDTTLPLTPPEWPEWGNPLTDPEAYDLIASYSPYDQVAARDYPPVLALGGLSDPRVTYWEPAKWVAKLRARTTGAAPILLRINMTAGHGGRSGRFEHLREPALIQAFALWAMGR